MVFFYLFGFLPTIAVMAVLKQRDYIFAWQYLIGGVISAAVSLSCFLLYTFETGLFLREFIESWTLLLVGGLTGIFIWLLEEWTTTKSRD